MKVGFRGNEYEAALKSIKDVIAAKVVQDECGRLLEVHVLAKSSRAAKQVVRDVQAVLLNKFGLGVDPGIVSVAQVRDGFETALAEPRCSLTSVQFSITGSTGYAAVELEFDGRKVRGEASGLVTSHSRLRLVSEATVAGFSQATDPSKVMCVEDLKEVQLGRFNVMVVGVTIAGEGTEQFVSGSSTIRRDETEAVARATLDALVRYWLTDG